MQEKIKPTAQSRPRIPRSGSKSYLQDWQRRMGIFANRGDPAQADPSNGWHSLIVDILAEIVLTAAQTDNALLAAEAQEWLTSPAAASFFTECNLNHQGVSQWLKEGCPLPEKENIFPREQLTAQSNIQLIYSGLLFGQLSTEIALPYARKQDLLDELARMAEEDYSYSGSYTED